MPFLFPEQPDVDTRPPTFRSVAALQRTIFSKVPVSNLEPSLASRPAPWRQEWNGSGSLSRGALQDHLGKVARLKAVLT